MEFSPSLLHRAHSRGFRVKKSITLLWPSSSAFAAINSCAFGGSSSKIS
jgi:hypothetical protein